MIVTDTIKRYAIAAVIVVMIVLMIACGILYKRTVALKTDNSELTTQITTLTSANESLQSELTKRKSVDQLTNNLSTQLSQLTTTIDQSARRTRDELHNSLKSQPCAATVLPADISKLLTNSGTK